MDEALPRQVDTVIVGSGPSALILSYILHGHIPVYDQSVPHPDNLLHDKLKPYKDLLSVDIDHLTEHFDASRFSYSTQALPVNVLLDALIRPLGETDDTGTTTCIKWQYDPTRAIPHVVVGNNPQTGGQWVSNPVKASWDIGALSYAGMLSLPGYSFSTFYEEEYGNQMSPYLRPSRREITRYFALYPAKVGISDAIFNNQNLSDIRRAGSGFYIASHGISCKHLILASGIFTTLIPPRPLLRPLAEMADPYEVSSSVPILVLGSGFSAADVIISATPAQKIIHIYKWMPSTSPSPLRACHQHAYPEYAGIYRRMKLAAISGQKGAKQPSGQPLSKRRTSTTAFDQCRDWDQTYEGLPNTTILDVQMEVDRKTALVTFHNDSTGTFKRQVSSLACVIGRRGSLQYLERSLQQEISPAYNTAQGLSARDMREQANQDLEVAGNVFIAGSLTGDTLIRFAYGGCVYAAGKIMEKSENESPAVQGKVSLTCNQVSGKSCNGKASSHSNDVSARYVKSMNGFDGHQSPRNSLNGENGARSGDAIMKQESTIDRKKGLVL